MVVSCKSDIIIASNNSWYKVDTWVMLSFNSFPTPIKSSTNTNTLSQIRNIGHFRRYLEIRFFSSFLMHGTFKMVQPLPSIGIILRLLINAETLFHRRMKTNNWLRRACHAQCIITMTWYYRVYSGFRPLITEHPMNHIQGSRFVSFCCVVPIISPRITSFSSCGNLIHLIHFAHYVGGHQKIYNVY